MAYMDVMINEKVGGWGLTYCFCLAGTLFNPAYSFLSI